MKKVLLLCALIGLGACGGGSSSPDAKIVVTDSSTDSGGDVCNPLANTGCPTGEKCSWIIDTFNGNDAIGHIGCVADGGKKVGEACMIGTGGRMATGADNCAAGLYCNGGVCKQVCDPAGGAPQCGENFACARYTNTFGNKGETAKAGVCDPTCDPLNNKLDSNGAENCGGDLVDDDMDAMTPSVPRFGCYGIWDEGGASRWSCAGAGNKAAKHDFELGDRVFINSCAPGYAPVLNKGNGSMVAICSALCNPGTVHIGNVTQKGGVQRPGNIDPIAATCPARGATAPAVDCVHGFIFEISTGGGLTPTKYSKLGVCMEWPRYNNSMAMPPGPFKVCSQLAKGTSAADSDALGQGCMPYDTFPSTLRPTEFKSAARHAAGFAFPSELN